MTTFQHRKYFFHLANKYASKLLNVKFILPRLNLYIFLKQKNYYYYYYRY